MKFRVEGVPRLRLLIAGVAAILLGISGIAAVMGWMPTTTEVAAVGLVLEKLQAQSDKPVGARVRVKCEECGVIVSTREIAQLGGGIDPAAAVGVARSGGRGISGASAKTYEVTARMKDGSNRVFMAENRVPWRLGERMIFIEGASRSGD